MLLPPPISPTYAAVRGRRCRTHTTAVKLRYGPRLNLTTLRMSCHCPGIAITVPFSGSNVLPQTRNLAQSTMYTVSLIFATLGGHRRRPVCSSHYRRRKRRVVVRVEVHSYLRITQSLPNRKGHAVRRSVQSRPPRICTCTHRCPIRLIRWEQHDQCGRDVVHMQLAISLCGGVSQADYQGSSSGPSGIRGVILVSHSHNLFMRLRQADADRVETAFRLQLIFRPIADSRRRGSSTQTTGPSLSTAT